MEKSTDYVDIDKHSNHSSGNLQDRNPYPTENKTNNSALEFSIIVTYELRGLDKTKGE